MEGGRAGGVESRDATKTRRHDLSREITRVLQEGEESELHIYVQII
jgi:hypothetical protein